MAPSKLSETDRQEITKLYCQPGETTATLADKFGVSSSTVSRALKQQLSEEDYSQLIQWKRSGERGDLILSVSVSESDRSPDLTVYSATEAASAEQEIEHDAKSAAEQAEEPDIPPDVEQETTREADLKITSDAEEGKEHSPKQAVEQRIAPDAGDDDIEQDAEQASAKGDESSPEQAIEQAAAEQPQEEAAEKVKEHAAEPKVDKPYKAPPVLNRRSRRRSTPQAADPDADDNQLPLQFESSEAGPVPTSMASDHSPDSIEDDGNEDIQDIDIAADWDTDDLDDADDYDDDYDDEDDIDDWDEGAGSDELASTIRREQLEILPFEDLTLQKPCYLVVDRLSELVTCPLKEFAELGLIPQEEEQARTLPVFDNHRVARRFSRRNQRIVKVPNGVMLTKTQQYLHAKGITRILFDGQVYALIPEPV